MDFEAYSNAKEAAAMDFESALRGVLAAHFEQLETMREALAQKDMAFLMALSLTEKGKRLDRDGVMVSKISEGLRGQGSLAPVEQRFIDEADRPTGRGE